MIPSHLSMVTLSPQRQAALAAIAEVEQRKEAGKRLSDYPHARAFFRVLTGKSRPRRSEMWKTGFYIAPTDRRVNLKDTERAFDALISSGGQCCPNPLSGSVRDQLFPEVFFKNRQRHEKRADLSYSKRERMQSKQKLQKTLLRRNLVDRAVIDLNFQTPDTIKSWYDRWQEELFSEELEVHFWRWLSRFPSLRGLKDYRFTGDPLWFVIDEASQKSAETPSRVKAVESLFVPNKLTVQQRGARYE
ncbi:plasmid SOS inhibition protein A [Pectobacterium brasiliense]|uniref:plasmid SOS inhibition protein A n=1 Tax=Pectobacterium brasiliense TaxID=180957 RepID=UPI001968F10A|nr:plasmid SOS inhibition protein A [Pectobacterium brasiliense]MBN3262992.1 plasmid SOS inhibition protein A [Pectobacterium brasiliense]